MCRKCTGDSSISPNTTNHNHKKESAHTHTHLPTHYTHSTHIHLAYFISMLYARNWSHLYIHTYIHITFTCWNIQREKTRISFYRMQNCQRLQKPFWMVYYSFRCAMLDAMCMCMCVCVRIHCIKNHHHFTETTLTRSCHFNK